MRQTGQTMLVIALILGLTLVGLFCASLSNPATGSKSKASSKPAKKTTDLDSAVSFLKKHNKPEVVGKVITTLKKEGYRTTEMTYARLEPFCGFSVLLEGHHNVEIRCEAPGLSNAKREKQLGISSMKDMKEEDSFYWVGGKFQTYPGGSTAAHGQKVLQKILGNFTVTSVNVHLPLPKNFSWENKKVVWEYGNNVIQKLRPELGKPTSKNFSWPGDEDDGWYVRWAKYEFCCNRLNKINELRVIVEEVNEKNLEQYYEDVL